MAAKTTKKRKISPVKDQTKVTSVLAKSDDGTIEITFTIPAPVIDENKQIAAKELAEDIEIPGFRKGKAPLEKVMPKIDPRNLIEKTLSKILPKAFAEAVDEYKLQPAIYPRFEIVGDNAEEWQVQATTCEIPNVDLGDYKKDIKDALLTPAIWTPEQGEDKKKELSREEKEQKVLDTLYQNVKVLIPKILIDEEVNSRLASLLQRLEKLGLTLESYLGSMNKKVDDLRKDYEVQARQTIALELILGKIALVEETHIHEEELDQAIEAASGGSPEIRKQLDTPEQRRVMASILLKRAVLDSLLALS